MDTEDSYIGQKLKTLRKRQNLSQKDVARYLDLSYQQVQQYEAGTSRIPAATLYKLSRLFHVQPGYFFEGLEDAITPSLKTNTINAKRRSLLRVLLVEDNPADEALLREALAELPLTLEHARDADACLAALTRNPEIGETQRVELVLMDLTLPRTSGMELLAAIKRNRSISDIPVLVLTNSIDSEDVIRAYRSGACGYLKKSPGIEDMQAQMRVTISYWSQIIMPSMQFVAL